jgi:hypothetical protein
VEVGPRFQMCDKCRVERQRKATKAYMAKARNEAPERIARIKARAKYRLTDEELDHLLEAAGETCQICLRPFTEEQDTKRAIDHHHSTGKVRGIICTKCNLGIGMANEDLARMERMAAYLRHHQST